METLKQEKICPLCGKPNRCGEKPVINNEEMKYCWCAYETFPRELLDRVPAENKGKACICINCINKFKEQKKLF